MTEPIRRRAAAAALCLALAAPALAWAQTAAPAPQRLRATVEKVELPRLTIRERSGEVVTVTLADNVAISEVVPIEIGAIQPGSYIGTASLPGPDGQLRALEVLVFPEAARGSGEGHYPWDLQPQSMMTNATVADLAASPQGRQLTLRYKDGEKKVLVPEGVPVVTFKPGDHSLLVVGAKVIVTAVLRDGVPTATRVLAGRNGFAPPM